jgi:NAD(P)-dependent dehydrogenase (short-subunit alcohol dehydrogenase family)
MTNPYGYDGKRVVVTGGSSGVGAALVGVLGELGASSIVIVDRNEPDRGAPGTFLQADLSDPGAVAALPARIEGAVDVLFNNAGVAGTLPARTVMAVNVLALRRLSADLLGRIPLGGAIVNTASIAGGRWPERLDAITELLAIDDWEEALAWVDDHPEDVADPYSFSKECVQVHTMRSARETMQRQVRTNSVCPAPIDTPLLPDFRVTMTDKVIDWCADQANGRLATAREVATVLAFLGSEAASYVNGVNMLVDGGFTAGMTTGLIDFAPLA